MSLMGVIEEKRDTEKIALTRLVVAVMLERGFAYEDAMAMVLRIYNRVGVSLAMLARLPEDQRSAFGDPTEIYQPMPKSRFEVE